VPTAKLWFLFLTPHVLDGGLWPDRAIDPALEVGVIRDERMRSSANCFAENRFPVIYPPQKIESRRNSLLCGVPIVQAVTQLKMYFIRPMVSDRPSDLS
jgi:hypothetical protein